MHETNVYVSFYGEDFNPIILEKALRISLDEKLKKGDIGTIGRYKEKPIEFGSAVLYTPQLYNNSSSNSKILWFLNKIEKIYNQIDSFHLEKINLHIEDAYENQFNFELDSSILARISKLKINLCVSAYQKQEKEIDLRTLFPKTNKKQDVFKREILKGFLLNYLITDENVLKNAFSTNQSAYSGVIKLREDVSVFSAATHSQKILSTNLLSKFRNFIAAEIKNKTFEELIEKEDPIKK